jgi:hypothetical protein
MIPRNPGYFNGFEHGVWVHRFIELGSFHRLELQINGRIQNGDYVLAYWMPKRDSYAFTLRRKNTVLAIGNGHLDFFELRYPEAFEPDVKQALKALFE